MHNYFWLSLASIIAFSLIEAPALQAAGMGDTQMVSTAPVAPIPAESFYEAVANGNYNDVVSWLDRGNVNIEEKGPEGLTPIQLAAKNGALEIAAILLKNEANCYAETSQKLTPLHFAVMSGNKNLVALFIDNDADVDAASINGVRPIHLAVQQGSQEIIDLLYAHGVQLNVKTNDALTPLHMAHSSTVADFLIQNGLDVNATDVYGQTPLHYAAENGLLDVVKLLIAHKARVDVQDKAGKTALDLARQNHHPDIVSVIQDRNNEMLRSRRMEIFRKMAVALVVPMVLVLGLLLYKRTARKKLDVKTNRLKPASKGLSWIKIGVVLMVGFLLLTLGFAYIEKKQMGTIAEARNQGAGFQQAAVRPKRKHPPCFCALSRAASKGDFSTVQKFVDQGENVNEQDRLGFTPLHIVLLSYEIGPPTQQKKDIAWLLVEKGANVNLNLDYQAESGYSLVVDPRFVELADLFDLMTLHGGDVNTKGMSGWTPLLQAVLLGNKDVVELILDKGGDVNSKGGELKQSPLHVAVEKDNLEIAQLLITKGADVNAKDKDGRPPLFFASSKALADLLVAKGAKIDMRDDAGMLPLHEIANADAAEALIAYGTDVNAQATGGHKWTPLISAAAGGRTSVVKVLLMHGADIQAKDDTGQSALDWASEYNHTECMSVLLANGARTSTEKNGLPSPLVTAILNANLNGVRKLLDAGADVNVMDAYGETPLHAATFNDKYLDTQKTSLTIARLLIDKGANVNAQTAKETISINGGPDPGQQSSPLHMAAISGNLDVATLLLEKGANVNAKTTMGVTPLHWASAANKLEIVDLLISHHADVNATDEQGRTPLHYSVTARSKEALTDFLIKHGANVNVVDRKGLTPLSYAASDKIAQLLLSNGANINARDAVGAAPLHHIVVTGAYDVVMLLLAQGADANAKDKFGETPLHWAAKAGGMAGVNGGVDALIAKGADVNMKDNAGNTPLMLAKDPSMIALLRSHGAK